jgi:hypothetical protein
MSAETIEYVRAHAPYFWQKVAIMGDLACWPYRGAQIDRGYGRYGDILAHRFAWMSAHGEGLSPEVVVRHRCDNPPCVNPAHLLTGTQWQNMQDAVARTFASACKNGHPRKPETTALTRKGHRRCLICDREQQRDRRAKARGVTSVQ